MLGSETTTSSYFEQFDINASINTLPCSTGHKDVQPVLVGLSCAAKGSGIAVASNVFTIDAAGPPVCASSSASCCGAWRVHVGGACCGRGGWVVSVAAVVS